MATGGDDDGRAATAAEGTGADEVDDTGGDDVDGTSGDEVDGTSENEVDGAGGDGVDGTSESEVDGTAERRLFGERRETVTAFVAGARGVLRAELSGDRVGSFGLVERCRARAIDDAHLGDSRDSGPVVATDDDVLVFADGEFQPTGFGPAVAVGSSTGPAAGTGVLAARPDGTVARLDRGNASAEWETLGRVDSPRRFDGDLLAAAGGVFRVGDGLEQIAPERITDVHDVARWEREAFVATGHGIYRGDGLDEAAWTLDHHEPARRLLATDDGVSAVTAGGVLSREPDGVWTERFEQRRLVDLAHRGGLYAITEDGTLWIAPEEASTTDGYAVWRSQPLGLGGVVGLVVSV